MRYQTELRDQRARVEIIDTTHPLLLRARQGLSD